MKVMVISALMLFGGFSCAQSVDPELGKLEVSVKVVNEQNEPVDGAVVKLYFSHTQFQQIDGLPTTKVFELVHEENNPVRQQYHGRRSVGIRVEKEGYWPSSTGHDFQHLDRVKGLSQHQYSREVTVILRKKENPRPLYVHRIDRLEIPDVGKPYGLDLEKGDWVNPYGKGIHADFIITIKRISGERPQFWSELVWEFSEPEDGLLEIGETTVPYSQLLLGQKAPSTEYASSYSRVVGVKKIDGELTRITQPPLSEIEKIEGCWFRIRSRTDENGNLQSRHGKMIGTVQYQPNRKKLPHISFVYFLAPDESPSLEWNGESLVKGANLQSVYKR